MTAEKKQVRIRIESSGGGQASKRQTDGVFYTTPVGSNYLRYPEPDPSLGNTATTVKWSDQEIKVIRHGDVQSDQTFVKGARMSGSYKLPHTETRMLLESVTRHIGFKKRARGTVIQWSYELYVDGAFTGVYKLKLDIDEL